MSLVDTVRDIAFNSAVRRAYQSDPHAFVNSCDALTDFERQLLLEADCAKIDGYLKNPEQYGPDKAPIRADAYTIIVLIAGIARHDVEDDSLEETFLADWDHVAEIAARQAGKFGEQRI